MTVNEQIALERYNNGEKPSVSTFIDEDTIIAGYGELNIDFEFPLSREIIEKEYGTTSWRQYFINKGLHRYLTVDKENKMESITPYLTEQEFEEHKKLNPNFKFEKL